MSHRQAEIDARLRKKFGPLTPSAKLLATHHGHELAVFIEGPSAIRNDPCPNGAVGVECVTCRVPDPEWEGAYTPCVLLRVLP